MRWWEFCYHFFKNSIVIGWQCFRWAESMFFIFRQTLLIANGLSSRFCVFGAIVIVIVVAGVVVIVHGVLMLHVGCRRQFLVGFCFLRFIRMIAVQCFQLLREKGMWLGQGHFSVAIDQIYLCVFNQPTEWWRFGQYVVFLRVLGDFWWIHKSSSHYRFVQINNPFLTEKYKINHELNWLENPCVFWLSLVA